MKNINFTIITIISALSSIGSAHAATATKNFNSTAQVSASCSIKPGAGSGMAFPLLTPQKTQQGEHSVSNSFMATCTTGTPYTVSVTPGNGTYAQRFMKHSNGDQLFYQLYHYGGTSKRVFGDGSNGTFTYSSVGVGYAQFIDFYALLDTTQFVTPGSYSDVITFMITY